MTTISSLSSSTSNTLLTDLEANGLSASKAQIVVGDMSSAVASAGGSTLGQVDMTTVRAALDKQIDADVSSGKLTASDAAEVKKTLDQIDAQTSGSGDSGSTLTDATTAAQTASTSSATTTTASTTQSSGAAKGGGGGGSASTKTEVSETVTISGALMVTTITYSDGSTSTTTTAATPQDIQKYGTQSDTAISSAAQAYLSTLGPGTLFSQTA